ncbi:MAG: SpoIIE family protein phosphatase [Enhygromyxa sp.]
MQVSAHIHGRPRIGETRSGDAGCVRTIDGVTWALLIDGLGHGPRAAEVAERAVEEHGSFTAELSVEAALTRLHAALEGTRGAAATLLRFGARTLGFGGIGNVSLRTLAGARVPFIAANGIVGHRPLRVRVGEIELSSPGRLLMFTDGIVPTAPLSTMAFLGAEALARTLIADHSLARDDATVMVLSYEP